jgi:hypothetical protein
MQKVVRHATLYNDLCPAAMLWAAGCLPWKMKYKAESWCPAQSFSNIDEEVKCDDSNFCKRSAKPYPSPGRFRNFRTGAGAMRVGGRFRRLLGYHYPKDAHTAESPA